MPQFPLLENDSYQQRGGTHKALEILCSVSSRWRGWRARHLEGPSRAKMGSAGMLGTVMGPGAWSTVWEGTQLGEVVQVFLSAAGGGEKFEIAGSAMANS